MRCYFMRNRHFGTVELVTDASDEAAATLATERDRGPRGELSSLMCGVAAAMCNGRRRCITA